jgi:hypothetical protein
MLRPLRLHSNTPSRSFRGSLHPSIDYEEARPPLTDRSNGSVLREVHGSDFKSSETALLHQLVFHSRAKSGARDILKKSLRKRNPSCYGENKDPISELKSTSDQYTKELEKAKIANWLNHNRTSRLRVRSRMRIA